MSDINALIAEMRAGFEKVNHGPHQLDITNEDQAPGLIDHIWRCSPGNIARLLDEIEALRAENTQIKAGPTEDELDTARSEGYEEGYSEGQSDAKSAHADLWSMLLGHLKKHDCEPASDDGYGHNAEQVMDAVFDREANILADSKRLAEAENARLREALTFYADGAPCCESDAGDGSLRTTRCASATCEFPECAKPQFPVWDIGRRAREALKGAA